MSGLNEQKPQVNRNIPGMNRRVRFVEVQHAENAGETVKRIVTYFTQEKKFVIGMLAVVVFGTLCGIYAPAVQSKTIDIIAGTRAESLVVTIFIMLAAYLLYSGSQLLQGLLRPVLASAS